MNDELRLYFLLVMLLSIVIDSMLSVVIGLKVDQSVFFKELRLQRTRKNLTVITSFLQGLLSKEDLQFYISPVRGHCFLKLSEEGFILGSSVLTGYRAAPQRRQKQITLDYFTCF